MGKRNVIHTHEGILLSLKKEENSDTGHNMDEPRGHHAMEDKPTTEKQKVYDPLI